MKRIRQMDYPIFIMISLFCFVGLIAVFSATLYSSAIRYGQDRTFFLIRQALFMMLGYGLYFFILFVDFRVHKRFAWFYLLGVLGMLLFVYVTGRSVLGAARWLDIGPFRLQPAEFAKIAVVIFVAYLFDKLSKQKIGIREITIGFFAVLGVLFFTLIQPDNGSVFIMVMTITIMYITLFKDEKRARNMILGAMIAVIAALVLLFVFFSNSSFSSDQNSHILTRFISWVNPFAEYETRGYQLSNSYIAISNGGSIGVGLGNGTQKLGYLPDGHTDFIVASMSEEFGLVIVAFVIVGYLILLWRMLKIASTVKSTFGKNVVLGLTLLFFAQAGWNLAGVSGVLPLKGLTAPFLSYGGSSLFMLFILFGIVQNIHIVDGIERKGGQKNADKQTVRTQRNTRSNRRVQSVQKREAKRTR